MSNFFIYNVGSLALVGTGVLMMQNTQLHDVGIIVAGVGGTALAFEALSIAGIMVLLTNFHPPAC